MREISFVEKEAVFFGIHVKGEKVNVVKKTARTTYVVELTELEALVLQNLLGRATTARAGLRGVIEGMYDKFHTAGVNSDWKQTDPMWEKKGEFILRMKDKKVTEKGMNK